MTSLSALADQITAEAHQVRFWHTVLAVLGAILLGLGWLSARIFVVAWFALAWVFTGLRVGWRLAMTQKARTPVAAIVRENEDLRQEIIALRNTLASQA